MPEDDYLKGKLKKFIPMLLVGLGVGALVLGLKLWLFPTSQRISESTVEVAEIEESGKGVWFVPPGAVAEKSGEPGPFVVRLKHLRAERLAVKVAGEAEGGLMLRSDQLKSGDLLVLRPGAVSEGQAVTPTGPLEDVRLIRLTLQAGMAAAMAEDLDESVRFISTNYRDESGYNINLMSRLLKRAYKEFDEPRIELAEPPVIQVKGSLAVVQAKARLTAIYQGRRNYLLGDKDAPNHILVQLEKSTYGWKISGIKGLRPLGFEGRFFRLLGAGVGLPLTEAEQREKKDACMPCRQRMVERFGLER